MTRLMLLGLLKQKSLSGYEIKQYLSLSHADKWAGIKTGSIYYALKKMEKEKLVEKKSVEYTGNRSRTIYEITERGETEFTEMLVNKLKKVDLNFPNSLYTTITFLGELDKQTASNAIDQHIKKLKKELDEWKQDEELKKHSQDTPLPKYMKALFVNGQKHIEANIEFLETVKKVLKDEKFNIELPPINEINRSE